MNNWDKLERELLKNNLKISRQDKQSKEKEERDYVEKNQVPFRTTALLRWVVSRHSTRAGREAQHPHYLGRRHWLLERQRLQPGHDGLQNTQHR